MIHLDTKLTHSNPFLSEIKSKIYGIELVFTLVIKGNQYGWSLSYEIQSMIFKGTRKTELGKLGVEVSYPTPTSFFLSQSKYVLEVFVTNGKSVWSKCNSYGYDKWLITFCLLRWSNIRSISVQKHSLYPSICHSNTTKDLLLYK